MDNMTARRRSRTADIHAGDKMTAGVRFRTSSLFIATLVGAFCIAVLTTSDADAQIQNSDQRKCILAINKAASKLAKAQGRQVAKCFKDATSGALPAASLDACVSDAGQKVASALQKVVDSAAKKCPDVPDFGFSGAATTNSVVINQELALVEDLYGDDLAAALVTGAADPDGARCQAAVTKRYSRIGSEVLRAFNDCKKDGLGTGAIDSTTALGNCLATVDADPKGKINKSVQKLGKDFLKRCSEPLAAPTAPFPGDCESAPDFLACAEAHAMCRACLELRNMDNISIDCESFDNGLVDASCIDPDADECAGENGGDNCDENATCTDEPDGFSCACDAGYEGDGVVCTDTDECTLGTDNCDANATCTNEPGTFSCACNLGFTGDGQTCTDIDECTLGTDNCDPVNASCANTQGGFICSCNSGFQGDGVTCTDIDECGTGTDNCDANAVCTNTIGSFNCVCNAGFTGDGVTCIDNDECAAGTDNCDGNATCTNVPGTFTCACNSGYSGDGVTCTDIDECAAGTDNCDANATCSNTPGSFTCSCNSGYSGSGVTCTDDNECLGEGSGNNCSVDADCANLAGSFTCDCSKGTSGNPFGSICAPIQLALTSPTHGIFTQAGSVGITGTVAVDDIADVSLTINGSPVTVDPGGTFSSSLTTNAATIFNEVRAVLTHTPTGYVTRDRVVVIVGPSNGLGANLPQSVGLRINDTGFNALEPILTSLVDLDLGTLIPPGTEFISDFCFLDSIFGCLTRGDVRVTGASIGNFGIDIDSQTNFIDGTISLTSLLVELRVDTNTVDCDLEITASSAVIDGDYTLEPDPGDATVIDVNQPNDVSVNFSNFNENFTSGVCDFLEPLLGGLLGDVEAQTRDGLVGFMRDPDGAGPGDGVIAQAIEDALGDVELTGPIGDGFGVNLDTPLFAIPEDTNGITLASGAIMTTANPDPGSPTFPQTLVIPATYPTAQLATGVTPIGGVAYGMGIAISESGFNQILAAQAESGSLSSDITELDLTGGGTPLPLTAGLFALLIPQFSQLDPATALTLQIRPTIAPALTGGVAPGGEIAELVISHLEISVVSGPVGMETNHGTFAVDAAAAFDLTIDPGTGDLVPAIAAPDPAEVLITLLENPLCIDEGQLQLTIPALIGPLVPQLAGAFGSFPLPTFLGLQPTAVEVSRVGEFLGVFLDVVPGP